MKTLFFLVFFTSAMLCNYSYAQISNTRTVESDQRMFESDSKFTYAQAHPNAKILLSSDFFFSKAEITAPFGNSQGAEVATGFRIWRLHNKTTSPVVYLKEQITMWTKPPLDYNELDTLKINQYIESYVSEDELQKKIEYLRELSKRTGDTSILKLTHIQFTESLKSSLRFDCLINFTIQDNKIIGIGFAQLVLEGLVDKDLKAITISALKRQLLPIFLNRYSEEILKTRKSQLLKMIDAITNSSS